MMVRVEPKRNSLKLQLLNYCYAVIPDMLCSDFLEVFWRGYSLADWLR